MHIMTATGWKALEVKQISKPGHVPSLLENMGISADYDPVAEMANYANSSGHGYYYDYHPDGSYTHR